LTASASGVSKTYDGNTSMSGVTVGLTGKEAGDVVTVSGNGAFATKDASATANINYSVSGLVMGSADAGNYYLTGGSSFSGNNGQINAKTVTLSASKTYDGSTSLAGFVTLGSLVGSEKLSYTGATANDAHVTTSSKFINAIALVNATDGSGGLASNYQLPTLDAAHATVTINAKALTATLTNTGVAKTYDGTTAAPAGFTPTYNVTGYASGDSAAVVTNTGAAYDSAAVGTATKVTVSGLALGGITGTGAPTDYALDASSKDVAASIAKAHLTVTANAANRLYGAANPALTATVSGFVNGETSASAAGFTGTGSATTTAVNTTTVGSAVITAGAGNLSAANYDFSTFTNGSLTINKAPLSVTASNASKTYDGVAYAGGNGVSYAGFVSGETASVLGGAVSYAGSSQGAVNTGSYVIAPSGLSSSNYTLSYANGALTVAAAPITAISGNLIGDVSKVYDGSSVATLASGNYLLSGFAGSDGATVTKTAGGTCQ
jgi:hypothetical protein